MTDNSLIGPKPDGPTYPTPWQADHDRILDADDARVFYLGHVDQPLLIGIVDAVNAYYGGEGGLNYLREVLDAKDTRIVNLEGRAQVAEERVKKLEKEHQERDKHWAIMVREVDKRDARIVELAEEINSLRDRNNEIQCRWSSELKRAQAAEERVRELERNVWSNERAEKAEARVRELEASLRNPVFCLGGVVRQEDHDESGRCPRFHKSKDTFTAPDGRVFRAGQRVQGAVSGLFATVKGFASHGLVELTYDGGGAGTTKATALRRVWDGSEEPDADIVRNRDGMRLFNGYNGWTDEGGLFELPWSRLFPEDFAPYVEVLPEDDE